MNTTLRTSSAAAKRSSSSLLASWLAAPARPVGQRAASREAHSLSLVTGWAQHATSRTVAPRASSREAHSLVTSWASEATGTPVAPRAAAREGKSLLQAWASKATGTPVPPRAAAREGKSLLQAWLVRDGVARQTPKDAIKRGPVPASGLAYRWILSDGLGRIGAEEVILPSATRGLFPVSKNALLGTWLVVDGTARVIGESAWRVGKVALGMTAGLLIVGAAADAAEASKNAQARKLMRRGSLAGARLSRKLSLH